MTMSRRTRDEVMIATLVAVRALLIEAKERAESEKLVEVLQSVFTTCGSVLDKAQKEMEAA